MDGANDVNPQGQPPQKDQWCCGALMVTCLGDFFIIASIIVGLVWLISVI